MLAVVAHLLVCGACCVCIRSRMGEDRSSSNRSQRAIQWLPSRAVSTFESKCETEQTVFGGVLYLLESARVHNVVHDDFCKLITVVNILSSVYTEKALAVTSLAIRRMAKRILLVYQCWRLEIWWRKGSKNPPATDLLLVVEERSVWGRSSSSEWTSTFDPTPGWVVIVESNADKSKWWRISFSRKKFCTGWGSFSYRDHECTRRFGDSSTGLKSASCSTWVFEKCSVQTPTRHVLIGPPPFDMTSSLWSRSHAPAILKRYLKSW